MVAMRRSEREVKDPARIEEIIRRCRICRLGFNDDGEVYIVPMNFGYERGEDGRHVFYFHCAHEGRKIDIIRKNPRACIEMDIYHTQEERDALGPGALHYQSIIGNGPVSFVSGDEDKRHAMAILRRHTGREERPLPESLVRRVCVLRLVADELVGKQH